MGHGNIAHEGLTIIEVLASPEKYGFTYSVPEASQSKAITNYYTRLEKYLKLIGLSQCTNKHRTLLLTWK